MLQAAQLCFGYNEAEDRIVLRAIAADASALNVLLSRRITRRLLAGFTDILARSSTLLHRVSVDDRMEVMVLEHLGAVSGVSPAGTSSAAAPTSGLAPPSSPMEEVLATRVHVQTLPDRFEIQIEAADGPRAGARLSRLEFHRVLSALDRFAEKAEWNLKGETGWLSQTEQVIRGRNPVEAS